MTDRERALGKIQKLLALANRPGTPEEGAAALSRAHMLAEKHGLTIRKKQVPSAARPFSDWLRDVFNNENVDREDAEREAQRHAAELQRRRTRIFNVRERGYDAWWNEEPVENVPFKQGSTFGVDQRAEWLRGWHNAAAGRSPFD